MMYPQALVDGTLVILEAGGRRYEYHGGDPLFLCENPTAAVGRRLSHAPTATGGQRSRSTSTCLAHDGDAREELH